MASGNVSVGVDEAGRGPVLGPLVVCAVYSSDPSVFADMGARDSKKLTPKRREELAPMIADAADHVEVVIASAEDIDAMNPPSGGLSRPGSPGWRWWRGTRPTTRTPWYPQRRWLRR